ncbi:MAG TPA: sigma-70 family RNA polymerase sigma factor [Solirubrobacteraceae bacterium]|nr:sigma-70 family RNA polymerase sigma factor [Solirubrobacteraceae bacterium]
MEASALRAPAGLGRLSLPSALLKLRSDEQLVAIFRAGNDEAFRVIHDRYRQRLFAYVRQMLAGSRSDAEDALQDVFLRAYNALRVDERPVALKAWLYRVAHNRCVDQLRRPVPAPADVFEISRPLMPDPLAETERRDDLRRLVADVQRLPEQQRSALLMRELEGLSYASLADALDVSVPAVKSLLVRARIGLVEAAEARDTACCDIRGDLALSFDKGVRASAKARRHMRECDGCRDYRTQLRGVKTELGALLPGPGPIALVAKLFGLGAGASGGGAAVVGGGAATGITAKVAALVCCAAVVGGGAVELRERTGIGAPAIKRDAPATETKRDRTATERMVAPTPVSARPSSTPQQIRTESARPKAATKAKAAQLRRSGPAPAARYEEPLTPHFRPSAAATTGTAATSTGGSAGPAEEEPATTSQPSSQPATSPTATGAAVTGAVTDPSGSGTGSSTTSTSPTATASSTSGSGAASGSDGTSSSSGGSTTTTPSSGSGGRR